MKAYKKRNYFTEQGLYLRTNWISSELKLLAQGS